MGKKVCCNPFGKEAMHSKSESDLRPVCEEDLWKFSSFDKKTFICSKCRKELRAYQPPTQDELIEESQPVSDKPSSQGSTVEFSDVEMRLDKFLGVSPVKRKRSRNESYMGSKLNEMQESVRKKFETEFHVSPQTENDKKIHGYDVIIQNMEEDIKNSTQRSQKVELLSLLPTTWSRKKIVDMFNVTDKCVRDAKSLRERQEQSEVLETKKRGRPSLDALIKDRVIQFYLDDENSKQFPGKNDCKSVVQADGKRKLEQKKLILCNLSELCESYHAKYPEDEISLSKFCELRPKQCVLAGSSGTHTVCVCVTHENVNLMFEGSKLKKLLSNSHLFNKAAISVNDILQKMVCSSPTIACYEQKCEACPVTNELNDHLSEIFEENEIEQINYRFWVTTERCTILNVCQDADEFLESFMINLKKLLLHDFIARKQAKFFSITKETLQPRVLTVVFDFAENVTFLAQRAASAFHWNNEQATLFPITVYFEENGSIRHHSYAAISDCLKHDSVAVYMFQKKLMELLKKKFGTIERILYFSDGAPQQFKNKKAFCNLCHHLSDFNIGAEWHFFATAHGKGPCDGLAGCIKRLAALASLQGYEILNSIQLFEWAKRNIKNIEFFYLSKDDYEETKDTLEKERFPFCKTVNGTQSYHAIIPMENPSGHVIAKTISDSSEFKTFKVITN